MPGGVPLPGLRITEIMYDPASPEADWEWVEILNNTGAAINFATQKHVLHDDDRADFADSEYCFGQSRARRRRRALQRVGEHARQHAGGLGQRNQFHPRRRPGATASANEGDTIAIWSSIDNYNLDKPGTGRSTAHAAAVATYDDTDPWPTNNNVASIFVGGLNLDPSAGGSWVRSGTDDDNLRSATANPVVGSLVDHPGGDVGSPGFAPGAAVPNVLGDYNGNHVVDAADYTVWRDATGQRRQLAERREPGERQPGRLQLLEVAFRCDGVGRRQPDGACRSRRARCHWLLAAVAQLVIGADRVTRPSSPRSSSLTASICSAVSSRQPVGEADQQREVGQAIDLPRNAVAEVVERFERVGREQVARRAGRAEPVGDVGRLFLRP